MIDRSCGRGHLMYDKIMPYCDLKNLICPQTELVRFIPSTASVFKPQASGVSVAHLTS